MAQSAEDVARESLECYNAGDFDSLRSPLDPKGVSPLVVGPVGLEPTTYGLKVRSSAN